MTAQEPEILIYNGNEMMMTTNPNLNNCIDVIPFGLCTANYRGYVWVWEIKDNKLFLKGLENNPLKTPVFANWISHKLHVWSGGLLHYVHAGYSSMYEKDIYFSIKEGILTGIKTEDNIDKFRQIAVEEIQRAANKTRFSYLYSCYLDPKGNLSKLIEGSKSAETPVAKRHKYIAVQRELEKEFQKKLQELSKDPESGIELVYKNE